jgi:hypothetical protein
MRLFFAASLLAAGVGCELSEPCDRYVDYMCDCHVTASECSQLRAELVGADPALQDQCAIDLSNQEAQDDDDGVVCEVSAF